MISAKQEHNSVDENLVISIIKQYLENHNFKITSSTFEAECNQMNKPVKKLHMNNMGKSSSLFAVLQNLMQLGQYEQFFEVWNSIVLPKSQKSSKGLMQELTFKLHLFFSIYPQHPLSLKYHGANSMKMEHTMQYLKKYFETSGSELIKNNDCLVYYALPFVTEPKTHPSFKQLFTMDWYKELLSKLETFLLQIESTKAIAPELISKLLPEGQSDSFTLEMMERSKQDSIYMKKYQQLQNDYQKLIEISMELVQALSKAMNGNTIESEYFETICQKLLELRRPSVAQSNAHLNQSTKSSSSEIFGKKESNIPFKIQYSELPNSAIKVPISESSHFDFETMAPFAPLDFEKIKSCFLQHPNNEIQGTHLALLLQALRLRLEKCDQVEKRSTIRTILNLDLFCFEFGHRGLIHDLSDLKSNRAVKEQAVKLFNCMAQEHVGREYLTKSDILIDFLVHSVEIEPFDSQIRQFSLGSLQKLSTRRKIQTKLIHGHFLETLLRLLEQEMSQMNDLSLEYISSILMNLCLRSEGKSVCSHQPAKVMKLISELMEHDNDHVRTFVNGILFSLLSVPVIKETAKSMGFEEILRLYRQSADETFAAQLDLLMEQLESETAEEFDTVSEDGDEMDDFEEDEETVHLPEQQEEMNQELKLDYSDLSGEAFLETNGYSLGKISNVVTSRPASRSQRPPSRYRPRTPFDRMVENNIQSSESLNEQKQQPIKALVPVPAVKTTIPPPPLNSKSLNKAGKYAIAPINEDDYHEAFTTRVRVSRTPDITELPMKQQQRPTYLPKFPKRS